MKIAGPASPAASALRLAVSKRGFASASCCAHQSAPPRSSCAGSAAAGSVVIARRAAVIAPPMSPRSSRNHARSASTGASDPSPSAAAGALSAACSHRSASSSRRMCEVTIAAPKHTVRFSASALGGRASIQRLTVVSWPCSRKNDQWRPTSSTAASRSPAALA